MIGKTKRVKKSKTKEFNKEDLKREILVDAKVVGVPVGAAEVIATKVVEQTAKWAEKRAAITVDDLNRRVAAEIAKYNADLSYVYKNRGKII